MDLFLLVLNNYVNIDQFAIALLPRAMLMGFFSGKSMRSERLNKLIKTSPFELGAALEPRREVHKRSDESDQTCTAETEKFSGRNRQQWVTEVRRVLRLLV
jgi:hypothetical protein